MLQQEPNKQLLFIYNANSGIANALIDVGEKYLKPAQYDCQLRKVSYGPFGQKHDWKKFIEELPYKVVFLHKDEFQELYPSYTFKPPNLLYKSGNSLRTLLQSNDFDKISSFDDLIEATNNVIKKLDVAKNQNTTNN